MAEAAVAVRTRKTEIALCKAGATLRQTGAGTLPLRGFPF